MGRVTSYLLLHRVLCGLRRARCRASSQGKQAVDVTEFGILSLLYKDTRAPDERALGLGAGGETGKAQGARAKERRVLGRPGLGVEEGRGPAAEGKAGTWRGRAEYRGWRARARVRAEGMGGHLAAKGRAAEGRGRGQAPGGAHQALESEGRGRGGGTWRSRVSGRRWASGSWAEGEGRHLRAREGRVAEGEGRAVEDRGRGAATDEGWAAGGRGWSRG